MNAESSGPLRTRGGWLLAAILATTVLVFARVYDHPFIHMDDDLYVVKQPIVHDGLTLSGARWALFDVSIGHWSPVTWFSHMTDVSVFGLHPGGHHLSSLLYHLANTVLLYILLVRMTRQTRPALIVAALFALHPFHVEAVASLSSRKDLLCALFWFCSALFYVEFAKRRSRLAYAGAMGAMALAIMAKPTAMTLPCVLLLLDLWPLNRIEMKGPVSAFAGRLTVLALEKAPFFGLSVLSGVMSYFAAGSVSILRDADAVPLLSRATTAFEVYAAYIGKSVAPVGLAAFYPASTGAPNWGNIAMSVALLIAISAYVLLKARRRPYLIVGWLWFLGVLAPVSGLVRYGQHVMADRYTYIPLIGLFIIVAWGIETHLAGAQRPRAALACVASVVALFALLAGRQVGTWRSEEALYRHALRVTQNNYLAHTNLGTALLDADRRLEALDHFATAAAIRPDYHPARYNLGYTSNRLGDYQRAAPELEAAVRLAPADAESHAELASAYANLGRLPAARDAYRRAIELDPAPDGPKINLGNVYARMGDFTAAIRIFEPIVEARPDHELAQWNLAKAHELSGDTPRAIAQLREILRLRPDFEKARALLAELEGSG